MFLHVFWGPHIYIMWSNFVDPRHRIIWSRCYQEIRKAVAEGQVQDFRTCRIAWLPQSAYNDYGDMRTQYTHDDMYVMCYMLWTLHIRVYKSYERLRQQLQLFFGAAPVCKPPSCLYDFTVSVIPVDERQKDTNWTTIPKNIPTKHEKWTKIHKLNHNTQKYTKKILKRNKKYQTLSKIHTEPQYTKIYHKI